MTEIIDQLRDVVGHEKFDRIMILNNSFESMVQVVCIVHEQPGQLDSIHASLLLWAVQKSQPVVLADTEEEFNRLHSKYLLEVRDKAEKLLGAGPDDTKH